jgi:hypothetical protein
MSIPAKDTHLAAINYHLRAVAIVFDFVNPVLAFGRLIDRGSKLRLDEPEAGSYAKHEARLCAAVVCAADHNVLADAVRSATL